MQAKNVLYAAVGAPVVAARRVSDRVTALKARVNKGASGYTEAAEKALNDWAAEGEKVVSRISKGAVVEEISHKMDLEQAKEQVGKLRDQLEDMLDTWRHSFRPEGNVEAEPQSTAPAKQEATTKPAETKATAPKKASTAKKPAAKKPAAKKPAGSSASKKTASESASKSSSASEASKAS